jgi:hypothetical protein
MTLAEQTTRRLILAGITRNDPGLVRIRAWNTAAYAKAGLPSPHDSLARRECRRAEGEQDER